MASLFGASVSLKRKDASSTVPATLKFDASASLFGLPALAQFDWSLDPGGPLGSAKGFGSASADIAIKSAGKYTVSVVARAPGIILGQAKSVIVIGGSPSATGIPRPAVGGGGGATGPGTGGGGAPATGAGTGAGTPSTGTSPGTTTTPGSSQTPSQPASTGRQSITSGTLIAPQANSTIDNPGGADKVSVSFSWNNFQHDVNFPVSYIVTVQDNQANLITAPADEGPGASQATVMCPKGWDNWKVSCAYKDGVGSSVETGYQGFTVAQGATQTTPIGTTVQAPSTGGQPKFKVGDHLRSIGNPNLTGFVNSIKEQTDQGLVPYDPQAAASRPAQQAWQYADRWWYGMNWEQSYQNNPAVDGESDLQYV